MRPHPWRGLVVAGYAALILLTIPIAPRLWLALSHATGLELEPLARTILLGAASVAVIPSLVRPGARTIAGLALVMSLYFAVSALPLEAPSERLHLVEYGVLPALVAWAFGRNRALAVRLGLGAVMAAGLGIIDEIVQGLTPGRVAQVQDVVLNIGSAAAGALTAWMLAPLQPPRDNG